MSQNFDIIKRVTCAKTRQQTKDLASHKQQSGVSLLNNRQTDRQMRDRLGEREIFHTRLFTFLCLTRTEARQKAKLAVKIILLNFKQFSGSSFSAQTNDPAICINGQSFDSATAPQAFVLSLFKPLVNYTIRFVHFIHDQIRVC